MSLKFTPETLLYISSYRRPYVIIYLSYSMGVNNVYVSFAMQLKIKVSYLSEQLLFLLDRIEEKSIPQAQKYITDHFMVWYRRFFKMRRGLAMFEVRNLTSSNDHSISLYYELNNDIWSSIWGNVDIFDNLLKHSFVKIILISAFRVNILNCSVVTRMYYFMSF
jgi:hypothetical protein